LVLIGIGKLIKSALLIALGFGALAVLHANVAHTVTSWMREMRVDPDNRFIHSMLERFFSITPAQLKGLSIGTFLYASLFLAEGIGLLLRKHWAEYFTIVTTALLLPLEIYELEQRLTFVRIAILALNVAIVWYLIVRVRSRTTRMRQAG
jgi:uncharacterized membrane protein (DUF2068 family)